MTTWIVVGLVGVGTIALKAAGPMMLERRAMSDRMQRMLDLLAPALLAALVITQALGADRGITLDARLPGVLAAAAAIAAQAPTMVVVVAAAGTTALVRVLGA